MPKGAHLKNSLKNELTNLQLKRYQGPASPVRTRITRSMERTIVAPSMLAIGAPSSSSSSSSPSSSGSSSKPGPKAKTSPKKKSTPSRQSRGRSPARKSTTIATTASQSPARGRDRSPGRTPKKKTAPSAKRRKAVTTTPRLAAGPVTSSPDEKVTRRGRPKRVASADDESMNATNSKRAKVEKTPLKGTRKSVRIQTPTTATTVASSSGTHSGGHQPNNRLVVPANNASSWYSYCSIM